jgi:Na+-driven multidrug efflux pump
MVAAVGLTLGMCAYFLGPALLSIYSSEPDVIRYGMLRLSVICTCYCLCGIMDVMVGMLRDLGYSFLPMAVSIFGVCGLRVMWIYTVFRWHHSLLWLYISYPATWVITGGIHLVCYIIVRKKQLHKTN